MCSANGCTTAACQIKLTILVWLQHVIHEIKVTCT